jgi:hypothetical protein
VVLPPAIRASTVSSASFAAKESPEACAVIETAPGEELQVDYGTGPMVRDPHTGKYRRTRLFVLTLGYSRKSVLLLPTTFGPLRQFNLAHPKLLIYLARRFSASPVFRP